MDRNGSILSSRFIKFSSDGKFLKSIDFRNNKLLGYNERVYNEDGELLEKIESKTQKTLEEKCTRTTFNSLGFPFHIITSIGNKVTVVEQEFVYDQNQNVIEMKRYINSEPNLILKRTLEYH